MLCRVRGKFTLFSFSSTSEVHDLLFLASFLTYLLLCIYSRLAASQPGTDAQVYLDQLIRVDKLHDATRI